MESAQHFRVVMYAPVNTQRMRRVGDLILHVPYWHVLLVTQSIATWNDVSDSAELPCYDATREQKTLGVGIVADGVVSNVVSNVILMPVDEIGSRAERAVYNREPGASR